MNARSMRQRRRQALMVGAGLLLGASTAWGNTGVFGLVYAPPVALGTIPVVVAIEGWLYRRMQVTQPYKISALLNALSALGGLVLTWGLTAQWGDGGWVYLDTPTDPRFRWALAGNFLLTLAIEGALARWWPRLRATGLRFAMVARANLWSYAFLAIVFYIPTILATYLKH